MSGIRAVSFTRHLGGGDDPVQRGVFVAACGARGWEAGCSIRQNGSGMRGLMAAVRLVVTGRYDVLVVDTLDRLAGTDTALTAVLRLLRRRGVRLLVACDGTDTADPVHAAVIDSLIG
ncbi:hypothetical protein E0504_42905 [Parafrankia sp. BMG5.11]|nr:hypothetical protein E0504_42905 [Parafrankia sp. BMG5.11]